MLRRKIIQINEELCDGCGQCVPSCHEGALKIIDGKAKLVKESYCDGLGACLGECPRGALSVIGADAEAFDEEALKTRITTGLHDKGPASNPVAQMQASQMQMPHQPHRSTGCPSTGTMVLNSGEKRSGTTGSKLKQWPVQLHLVPPFAPFFANTDLYLIADCVPFAYPDLHEELLDGHAIAIACPKLDDTENYMRKILNIIKASSVKSITVVVMEVPCCSGLVHIAREAVRESGVNMPFDVIVVGIQGGILQRTAV